MPFLSFPYARVLSVMSEFPGRLLARFLFLLRKRFGRQATARSLATMSHCPELNGVAGEIALH